MAIKAGKFIVGKTANLVVVDEAADIKTEQLAVPVPVPMEDGTVIHNGQPKKFNKKMSAYMIDMLTSED